uniref:GLOBIN domain-containing protein n=1 Tax=Rhabditophanes sp. KR3021 TaxID=114890 RepID=A0AC35UD46_9BILA
MGCTQAKVQQDETVDATKEKNSTSMLGDNLKLSSRPHSSHSMKTKSHHHKYNLIKEEKHILQKHWEHTVLKQFPDSSLFLNTMLVSIKESPKLLDVINCRMSDPNIAELAKWPKLNCMATGNCKFFTKQIITNKLEESLVRKDSEILGAVHIKYTPYGFKPTFLDIWHNNILKIIKEEVKFEDEEEKTQFLGAFKKLTSFLITILLVEYEDHMGDVRRHDRETNGINKSPGPDSKCPVSF